MDTIYLCVRYGKTAIVECKPFDSYDKADNYYTQILPHTQSTMVPINKYIPTSWHERILQYKVGKTFVKTKIVNQIDYIKDDTGSKKQ